MKISVALATFNGETFLARQLASILEQDRVPDEVVIRDDCSSDGTHRIVEAFARDFPGQVDFAVNPVRRGVTGNFEAALSATTGDLVLLSDQDDVWYRHRVAQAEQAFEADPSLLLLFADARLVDALGQPLGTTQMQSLGMREDEGARIRCGLAFEVFATRNLPLGATVCIRRAVLDDVMPIPASWLHDEWIALIAAAKGRVAYIDAPVIDYRQHGGNVLGAAPRSIRDKVAAVFAPKRDVRSAMVARATVLGERVRAMGAQPRMQSVCAEMLVHARVRGGLPGTRALRIVPILREAVSGRYTRCSTGWRAMVVDLLRPIDHHGAPGARVPERRA
jgi:glycosyltransferase involved in cell wall biosynthesis